MKIAPGAAAMLNNERAAASHALATKVYCTFKCTHTNLAMPNSLDFCSRVAPSSLCFCGHSYADHLLSKKTLGKTKCKACPADSCRNYEFIFTRPEECGEDWLPRRRGFDVNSWKAK